MPIHSIQKPNPVWQQFLQDHKIQFLLELANPKSFDVLTSIQLVGFNYLSHKNGLLVGRAEYLFEYKEQRYSIVFDGQYGRYHLKRIVTPQVEFTWSLHNFIRPSELNEKEFYSVLYDFTVLCLLENEKEGDDPNDETKT